MRTLVGICVVVGATAGHADAGVYDNSDTLPPSRVTVKASGVMARLDARFTVEVAGPASPLVNNPAIALPEGAVIVSASVRSGDHVEHLALENVEKVETAFAGLYERDGSGSARRWAIRIDPGMTGEASIEVAAPRDATLLLDIGFEVATCFVSDARYVKIPREWMPALASKVAPGLLDHDVDEVCGQSSTGDWVALPARELANKPAGDARVGITAGRLSLSSRDIARVELALAGALTEIPKDLYTAIVIDASRSLTADERENQRALVEAYVRAAPRGRVQVIAYARTAEPLLSGWSIAERAALRIDRAIRDIAPRNGSNVDEGLAVAGAWLSNVQGTRRVIVMTDERLADRLSSAPEALRDLLPKDVLLHAVTVSGDDGKIMRTDDALFAPLALATGGIAAIAGVDELGDIDALSLARPTALDGVTIEGAGWKEELIIDERTCPDGSGLPLPEGRSCVWWVDGTRASGQITVTGWLWGREVTRVIRPDAGQARSVARVLSTMSWDAGDLLKEVETAARAVNSVWSLFAMWGKSGGYSDLEEMGYGSSWLSGFSCCGGGGPSTSTVGTIGGFLVPADELHTLLGGAVARCHPNVAVTIALEITGDEIVGVDVRGVGGPVADCIADGVWDTTIALANMSGHTTTTLVFQPT